MICAGCVFKLNKFNVNSSIEGFWKCNQFQLISSFIELSAQLIPWVWVGTYLSEQHGFQVGGLLWRGNNHYFCNSVCRAKITFFTFKRNVFQSIILHTFPVPFEIKGLQTESNITELQLPGRPKPHVLIKRSVYNWDILKDQGDPVLFHLTQLKSFPLSICLILLMYNYTANGGLKPLNMIWNLSSQNKRAVCI